MEGFNTQMNQHNSPSQRGNHFPPYLTSSLVSPNQNSNMDINMNTLIHLHSAADYFPPPESFQHHQSASVKSEAAGSSRHHASHGASPPLFRIFQNYHPLVARSEERRNPPETRTDGGSSSGATTTKDAGGGGDVEDMKARIIAHPQYSNLLQAYMDCQKVGAPPDVSARLSALRLECESRQRSSISGRNSSKDPELDQFMEAYYDMLVKYREELTRPVQEAMEFMQRIEAQLNALTNGNARIAHPDERSDGIGSSEEEPENSGGETELPEIDPRAEDRELKNHLLKKYSGYLSSLKQELSKKKKKGKLPKEARQKLLSWWELHYKWPYPSESEKVALAEATGLDQKQINNWFINQRKRHWKPSEDMQFMVMDGIHPHSAALYMEGHYMGDGPYRYGT